MIKRIAWLLIFLLCGCGQPVKQPDAHLPPERIVSLAPNITGTLYDLGLGSRIVGVSKFSNADQVTDLPIVGDFMNINYEAIVSLTPDLVILEKSSDGQKARLQGLGIPYLETGSLTIAEILESIRKIGMVCDVDAKATELIDGFNHRIETLRYSPTHRPRTLIAFGDFSNHAKVEQLYAFGAQCIHSELLEIAGGDNVIADARPSAVLSREAIMRLDPELIIELTTGGPTNHWETLPSLNAVQHGRIHVLDGTYTTIPSPSCLIQTLEDFTGIIRDEIKTE